jgi:uncharacterized protein YneF (UPF0154 family)
MKKKDHCFDYIVIGAGLSGLIMTAGLKRKGFDVLLLDGADFAGGASRSVFTPIGLADNGLKMISFNENLDFDQITKQLSEILVENITYEIVDNSPITFVQKEMKPFVGFGSFAPEFHKPLSYYLTNKRINFLLNGSIISIGEIISKLVGVIGGAFVSRSMATQFVQDENGRITQVTVNGVKNIFGLNFIYCGSPKMFSALLPTSSIAPKLRQKIAKGIYWTTICLDFFHKKPVSDRTELHMLNGTTQDEIGPCIGLFHPPVLNKENAEETVQHSQWLTFLDDESTSDTEVMGAILKKIKKQIKRAYSDVFENLISERIAVLPYNEAELDIKMPDNFLVPGFINLYVGSGAWSGFSSILGSLLHTQKMLSGIEALVPVTESKVRLLNSVEHTDSISV